MQPQKLMGSRLLLVQSFPRILALLPLSFSGGYVEAIAIDQQSEMLDQLSMDELIERLPMVLEEWDGNSLELLLPSVQEMRRRCKSGQALTADQLLHALLRTQALRFHRKLPLGVPFAISLRSPSWLTGRVRLVPRHDNLTAAEVGSVVDADCGNVAVGDYEKWCYQELGRLPLGHHVLTFDVWTQRQGLDLTLMGAFQLEVDVASSVDEVFRPIASPSIDLAVRRSIGVCFEHDAVRRGLLIVDPDTKNDAALRELGLSLYVEVLYKGTIRDKYCLVPKDTNPLLNALSVHLCASSIIEVQFLPSLLEYTPSEESDWSIRIKGVSRDVWRQWHARSYWEGELVMPIKELLRREDELGHGLTR